MDIKDKVINDLLSRIAILEREIEAKEKIIEEIRKYMTESSMTLF